jgi:peptidoglycan hydrolase-like protein with peptidoglycan-binding domain
VARRKRVEEVAEETSVRQVAVVPAVLWSASAIAAGFILYNVFLGQSQRAIDLAQSRNTDLQRTAEKAEAQLGNNTTVIVQYDPLVEEAQRLLLATGYYKGLVDGVRGQRTLEAIHAYQRQNNLQLTQKITPQLLEHMKYMRKLNDASQFTGSTGEVAQKPAGPVGPVGNVLIMRVQNALAAMGYDPGEPDGKLSPKTREAIARFEQENKLRVDGEIDRALIVELARITNDGALLKLAN